LIDVCLKKHSPVPGLPVQYPSPFTARHRDYLSTTLLQHQPLWMEQPEYADAYFSLRLRYGYGQHEEQG
jgi:hypothetical protein